MKSFAQDRSEVCACMLHAFTQFLLFACSKRVRASHTAKLPLPLQPS